MFSPNGYDNEIDSRKRGKDVTIEAFDDGHIPETFKLDQNYCNNIENYDDLFNGNQSRIAKYQPGAFKNGVQPKILSVYPNALPDNLCKKIYQITNDMSEKTWGTYVAISEILQEVDSEQSPAKPFLQDNNNDVNNKTEEAKKKNLSASGINDGDESSEDSQIHHLARLAVSHFLLDKVEPSHHILANHNGSKNRNEIPKSVIKIHGCAVWALSSNTHDQVHYHIDYAELIRYKQNLIYPPIYAGTIHCSPLNTKCRVNGDVGIMKGGDFAINTSGLEHYEAHGYKGRKSNDPFGGYNYESCHVFSNDDRMHDSGSKRQHYDLYEDLLNLKSPESKHKSSWVHIPYRYNQGIFYEGTYPHLSTRVNEISLLSNEYKSSKKMSRVIVGFNFFGDDVGPTIQKAPEHSKKFKRQVKLMRALTQGAANFLTKQNICKRNIENPYIHLEQNVVCESAASSIGQRSRTESFSKKKANSIRTNEDNEGKKEKKHQLLSKLKLVKKNKGFTKLLVLAKREVVKRAHDEERRKIFEFICHKVSIEERIQISSIMKMLATQNRDATLRDQPDHIEHLGATHPLISTETDILVYINNWLDCGKFKEFGVEVMASQNGCQCKDTQGIVFPTSLLVFKKEIKQM